MTNEQYIEAMEKRCSRRSYKSVPLSEEILSVIGDMVDAVNKSEGLHFILMKNDTKPFTVITGKFSYIAVCGKDTQQIREKCGYFGESIVLQCVYHGLGTCWVTGTYNENAVLEAIKLPKDERLYGVIVVGNVTPKKSTKEKIVYNATHKKNKPYQKMFSACDQKLPSEYANALKLVEGAPSAVNRRPVDFKYVNGVLSARVEDPYSDKSIDLGIAKLHFKVGMTNEGIIGDWNEADEFIVDDEKIVKFPTSEE